MYSSWKVSDLKEELRKRGGSLKGRKADLVSRLESFDRNFNFGIPQQHETDDPKPDLPAPENYHDINSSTVLPPLTKQHIRLYFNEYEKKPEDGLVLYEARYLLVVRAAVCNNFTFIKGICLASMKKLQYEINIKINQSGEIAECCCECVAGSGCSAHCKHVAAVLYAVEHMVHDKIMIKHQVPTERLQKFHAPKQKFQSTPIRSSKLPSKRKLENIIFSPITGTINAQTYNNKFKSLINNYPMSKMPYKQMLKPANPYALEWDHSYTSSNENNILEQLGHKEVSLEKIVAIELETRGQTSNNNWFKHREIRITASRFHTICHLRTCNQEKFAHQMLYKTRFSSKSTNHGIINEKIALQNYMENTGLQVVQCGLFVSVEDPYLAASPDGLLGEETIIEIKCPYSSRNMTITPLTVPYLTLDCNNHLKLKESSPYYYQVQGQMYCSNRKYCNLIIYTYIDMKVIYLERDSIFISNMLEQLKKFYANHFKVAILNKFLFKNYLTLIKKEE